MLRREQPYARVVVPDHKQIRSGTLRRVIADAGLTVKAMMEEHVRLMGEIHATQAQLLHAALKRQRDTVASAVTNVAEKIEGQTSDFLAIMGQFTN